MPPILRKARISIRAFAFVDLSMVTICHHGRGIDPTGLFPMIRGRRPGLSCALVSKIEHFYGPEGAALLADALVKQEAGRLSRAPDHEGSDSNGELAPHHTSDAGRDRISRRGAFVAAAGEGRQAAPSAHDAPV
jgi:hypothetical protein